MMKPDKMTDQERRVYEALEKREHYLSDGFEYYLPYGWAMEIDGVWHDADSQDEMMLIIVRELIKAVEVNVDELTERVEIAFRMLYRIAPYWGDLLGLVWSIDDVKDARRIIAEGTSCEEWESTRREIGLSHDEAVEVGEKITRFDEVSETAPRYTIGDYLDRFNRD